MSFISKYPCRYIITNDIDSINNDNIKESNDVTEIIDSMYNKSDNNHYSIISPNNVCLYFEYVENYNTNILSTPMNIMYIDKDVLNNSYNVTTFIKEIITFIKRFVNPEFEYNGKWYTEPANVFKRDSNITEYIDYGIKSVKLHPFLNSRSHDRKNYKVYPKYNEYIVYVHKNNKNITYKIVFPYVYMKTLEEIKTLTNMFLYYFPYHKQYLNTKIYEENYIWSLPTYKEKSSEITVVNNFVFNYGLYVNLSLYNNVLSLYSFNDCIQYCKLIPENEYYLSTASYHKDDAIFVLRKYYALCMVNFIDNSVSLCIKADWSKFNILPFLENEED